MKQETAELSPELLAALRRVSEQHGLEEGGSHGAELAEPLLRELGFSEDDRTAALDLLHKSFLSV